MQNVAESCEGKAARHRKSDGDVCAGERTNPYDPFTPVFERSIPHVRNCILRGTGFCITKVTASRQTDVVYLDYRRAAVNFSTNRKTSL